MNDGDKYIRGKYVDGVPAMDTGAIEFNRRARRLFCRLKWLLVLLFVVLFAVFCIYNYTCPLVVVIDNDDSSISSPIYQYYGSSTQIDGEYVSSPLWPKIRDEEIDFGGGTIEGSRLSSPIQR